MTTPPEASPTAPATPSPATPDAGAAHAPWASAISAWLTSATLGVVVLLIMVAGSDGAFVYALGSGIGEARILGPLLALVAAACTAAAVTLAWLRPVSATLLLTIPTFTAVTLSADIGWWVAVVAVAALQTVRGTWVAVVTWLGAIAVTVVLTAGGLTFTTPFFPIALDQSKAPYLQVWLVLLGLVLTGALATRAVLRSRRRSEAAIRAGHEAERAATARTSLLAERSQVARDLHDVVAHHVSLVAVRAESARYTTTDLDPATRETLDAIAEDARRALTELRSTLTVLDRSIADGGEATAAPRAPQPAAADVLGLLEAAREVGQEVVVTPDDDALAALLAEVGPAPGYVLARCVQESLTNARRHAAGARVEVSLALTPDGDGARRVVLEVGNAVPDGTPAVVVPGRGLVGLHERVSLVGGTSTAGPDGGRFTVRAALPLDGGTSPSPVGD